VNILRKILFPFALLYGEIISLRNKAYDLGIFQSTNFTIPIILVGNLNVGGTGKTPQIEYLVRLLQEKYSLAILSRGYKRRSKGFQIAGQNSTVDQIGDEPMQFQRKFENVTVVVDGDRVNGVRQLEKIETPPQVVLLDDAFQHRNIQAGLSILLTSYSNLYVDDKMLPTGNLREKISGAKRANIIVVSKCPDDITTKEQTTITQKLKPILGQSIFFSTIVYQDEVINKTSQIPVSELNKYEVILVTGIANAKPMLDYLKNKDIEYNHLSYRDHYDFSVKEKEAIFDKLDKIESKNKIVLTTEKDYVRTFSNGNNKVYYLPIRTKILDKENDFNRIILNYVQQNSGNSSVFKR